MTYTEAFGEYNLPEPVATTENFPQQEWRVTTPMRSPRYFTTADEAHRYAHHTPDPRIHVREYYLLGGSTGWREDT